MPATAFGPADPAGALADLRGARRRNRLAEVHWVDALYQVYVTALVGVGVTLWLSGWLAGEKLGPWRTSLVLRDGPDVIGLVVAVGLLVGLRSGARGGPVAVEGADARHVLLAPVDRALALRGPALRQLRFGAFTALAVGAVAGQLAVRRLGDQPVLWVLCGALFALVTFGLGYGAALLAGGRRLPIRVANLLGVAVVAWAVADVVDLVHWSPTGLVGTIPLWPLEFEPLALVPVAVAVAAVGGGLLAVGGVPLEAAERRTRLVGQLRFAATLQDLRTVLVLRRQLAMELPRARPWVAQRRRGRLPVWQRGVRGLARWPSARIVRVLALGLAAGAALRMVADGTGAMVLVAGLALYVAALDAVEAMAQEADHPGRTEGLPQHRGGLLVRHLATAIVVMVVVTVAGAGLALALEPTASGLAVAAIAVVPAVLAPTAGAALSVLQGIQEPSATWDLVPPEAQGMRTVVRVAGPPTVAVIGALPVLFARRALDAGGDPVLAAAVAAVVAVGVAALAIGWIHQRDEIKAWFRTLQEQAGAAPSGPRPAASGPPDHPTRKPTPTKVTTSLPRKR